MMVDPFTSVDHFKYYVIRLLFCGAFHYIFNSIDLDLYLTF